MELVDGQDAIDEEEGIVSGPDEVLDPDQLSDFDGKAEDGIEQDARHPVSARCGRPSSSRAASSDTPPGVPW